MKKLLPEHETFIAQYTPTIKKKVANSAIKCSQERNDCFQYVCIELIKAYSNRLKYADWDNVVRAVISRRIKDYIGKMMRSPAATGSFINAQRGYTVYGDQLITQYDEADNPSGWDLDVESEGDVERSERLESLRKTWNSICDHEEDLTDWEVNYLYTLERLSYEGVIPDDSAGIVREMGQRASVKVISEYNTNVAELRNKLQQWQIRS